MKLNELIKILEKLPDIPKYLVGGIVRDTILNRDTKDIDIILHVPDVKSVAKKIADKLDASLVVLDEDRHIYRVVSEDYNFDFTRMRGRDIYDDLSERDFTVNSIAVEFGKCRLLNNGKFKFSEYIDPYDGIKDIKNKLIKHVSDNVFNDDPLRLLRAYRFIAELGFKLDARTERLIKKQSRLIKLPARERVTYELTKILSVRDSSAVIILLDNAGILGRIFPEIKNIKSSPKKYYFHPKGLWQHATQSVAAIEYLLNNLNKLFPKTSARTKEHIKSRIQLLKLVALLHDISKPETVKMIGGRPRFFDHEIKGAKKTSKIMARLKYSNKSIAIAAKLIINHMRPGNLSQLKKITDRAIYRFFRDIGEESADLLLLSLADRYTYIKYTGRVNDYILHKKFVNMMLLRYFKYQSQQTVLPKLIDGNIIMKKFKLQPGPIIGRLLSIIRENQIIGNIRNTEQALELVKKNIDKYL